MSNPHRLTILVCLAQFMVILDIAIVNVALPSIRASLDFSPTGLQWIVNAYTVAFAGLLMLSGRASDLVGSRRVFLIGMVVFSLASLACAVADQRAFLIGARSIQGLGAAIISASSLAIITAAFPPGRDRSHALGIWGAMTGFGGAAGSLLGGLLTQSFGWPSIFLINVPIGLAVFAAGRRSIPADRVRSTDRQFDFAGGILISVGLCALTYAVVRTGELSWVSPGVILPFFGAVLALGLFILVEGKLARDPLIPLAIFRMRSLRASSIVIGLLFIGIFAMWFFLSLYLQQVLGQDALRTGLSFLPLAISQAIASALAPSLVARFGARPMMILGLLLAALGFLWLTDLRAGGSYVTDVLPGGVLATFGTGTAMIPATIVGVKGVPVTQSGLASGVLNTSRLCGGTIGLAALSTIATAVSDARLTDGADRLAALSDGYSFAMLLGAVSCGLAALVVAASVRDRHGNIDR